MEKKQGNIGLPGKLVSRTMRGGKCYGHKIRDFFLSLRTQKVTTTWLEQRNGERPTENHFRPSPLFSPLSSWVLINFPCKDPRGDQTYPLSSIGQSQKTEVVLVVSCFLDFFCNFRWKLQLRFAIVLCAKQHSDAYSRRQFV